MMPSVRVKLCDTRVDTIIFWFKDISRSPFASGAQIFHRHFTAVFPLMMTMVVVLVAAVRRPAVIGIPEERTPSKAGQSTKHRNHNNPAQSSLHQICICICPETLSARTAVAIAPKPSYFKTMIDKRPWLCDRY